MADYQQLGAIGGGLSNFMDTYLKAKQMRQQNDLQKQQLGLMSAQHGLIQNQDTGEYEPNQVESLKRQEALQDYAKEGPLHDTYLAAANAQNKKVNKGASDLPSDLTNKELLSFMSATKPQYAGTISEENAGLKNQFMGGLIQNKQDTLTENTHQKVLARVLNDPNSRAKINQYQNLQGALNNVANAEKLTPQSIDEFQQAIRANLGIKGTSGVEERGKDYFNSSGLNYDRFKQFLTGDPVSISQNDEIVKHLKDLANLENKNIQNQMDKAVNSASAGNGSFYKKHPDKYQDLLDAVKQKREQVGIQDQGAGQPQQGLMQSPQGLLPQAQGPAPVQPSAPVSPAAAPAAQSTKVINGHTYQKVNGGWQLAE